MHTVSCTCGWAVPAACLGGVATLRLLPGQAMWVLMGLVETRTLVKLFT